jgi:hypothetical protein
VTRPRAGIAIILLMGGLALCTLTSYALILARSPAGRSDIDMNAERFGALREMLPARGVVGYLSDASAGFEDTKAYYLTEYYLAPVVVARGDTHELVVANFRSRSEIAAAAEAHGLAIERDFSNGVGLLRRQPRRQRP